MAKNSESKKEVIIILSPDYLKGLPDNIIKIFEELEEQVIADISKNLARDMELTDSADYKISQLNRLGYDIKDIKKKISKTSTIAEDRLDELLQDSAYKSYENDKNLYKQSGKTLPGINKNPMMNSFIISVIKQTKGELRNITNTLGFVDNGNFKDMDKFYKDTLDYATFQLGSDLYDYNTVLRQAVKKVSDSGLRTIDYESGRSYHIDSAIRMNVMTGVTQITGRMSEMNADMMDQDLMEITAHSRARPDHQTWQGQIVSRSGKRGYLSLKDIGYETAGGFQGANCRHGWFPYFEGISKPAYTKEELNNIDPAPFEYDGKIYDAYSASQKQRYIERQMRSTKRDLIAYDNAGLKDDFTASSIRLKRQRELYKDFSKKAKLREKFDRTGIYGYNRSISSKSVWADKKLKEKANSMYGLGSTKANVNAYLRDKPIRDQILSNKTIKDIHKGRQGKHILEHNNYINGRSYILGDYEFAQKLVNEYASKGIILRNKNGKWRKRELIKNDEYVGVNINNVDGALKYTDRFYIVYSEDGTHIIPTLKGE